ncbi:hypothetical protein ACIA5D_28360 [Actinoplanes sp. NPDC051513]|uniref:hypothetical protein n=1 Tax=Actinoplanes sp. NPDC051513 TaxID=3363908 RepID=UPI0037BA7327
MAIFLLASVISHVVSTVTWSPYGGGDSVAICGVVGALSVLYALRGDRLVLRRHSLLVPVAALVLLLLTNNHGVGLAAGCLLGLLSACHDPRKRAADSASAVRSSMIMAVDRGYGLRDDKVVENQVPWVISTDLALCWIIVRVWTIMTTASVGRMAFRVTGDALRSRR